jgi:hypothetical protein
MTPGFGGQGRRNVTIQAGAKYVKIIGFFAMFLTGRAEWNRFITHLGIRTVYGFWVKMGAPSGSAEE